MDNKKFLISENKISGFLGVFVVSTLLSLYACTKMFDFDSDPWFYVIICVSIGLVLGALMAVFIQNKYFQILDDGFEIIEGKKVTKYDFTDYVGSNVVKHYTNGIPTGTTREIKIQKPNSKVVTISTSLSGKKFAELVNFLGNAEYKETHNEEIPANAFSEKVVYEVPAKSILRANKMMFIFFVVLAVILAIVGPILITMESQLIPRFFGGFAVAGAIVALILGIAPWGKKYFKVRSIPSQISLDSLAIVIDGKVFKADSITNISMVPASYKILTRDLIITTKDGVKHVYNFGKGGEKDKYTYNRYADLALTMKVWCLSQKISFMSILG